MSDELQGLTHARGGPWVRIRAVEASRPPEFEVAISTPEAFGASFEMPVVVFFLASAGILTVKQLLKSFPYAVLVCFVLGAVLTPSTDWVSQTLLAVPMAVLYLLGVLAAWLFGGSRARAASKELAATGPPS